MPTRSPDLISTGEAAALLGSSRQHVVDLCNRGELPALSIGRHRRVRREDVERFAARATVTQPLRREELLSLWLGRAVAAQVAGQPARSLEHARRNLELLERENPQARPLLRLWRQAIDEGPEAVMEVLTSRTPAAIDMRQTSPFFGLIPQEERDRVVGQFHEYWAQHRVRP